MAPRADTLAVAETGTVAETSLAPRADALAIAEASTVAERSPVGSAKASDLFVKSASDLVAPRSAVFC